MLTYYNISFLNCQPSVVRKLFYFFRPNGTGNFVPLLLGLCRELPIVYRVTPRWMLVFKMQPCQTLNTIGRKGWAHECTNGILVQFPDWSSFRVSGVQMGCDLFSGKSDDLQPLKLQFPRSVYSDIILIMYGRVSQPSASSHYGMLPCERCW